MERKTAADPISQSADIVSENIEKLKQLFPSICIEGNIDFEALKEILGDKVETDPEYYRFTWPGKAMAKAEARKPSRGTLRPAKDESVNWDTTENLYIEGDNLEVLKLLQKSYANKVKMIYIDPPYNTGKDFVYKDNYKDNLANYNEKFNRKDKDGNLKSSASEINQEGSARYHSNWLNMMYPRLTLARNLLTEDGVIFISIDDNEAKNLKNICDEIFGEDNFVANVVWQKKYGPANDAKGMSDTHEHLIIYSKDKNIWVPELLPRNEKQLSAYKNPDNDPRGVWRASDLSVRTPSENCMYPITGPDGQVHMPPKSTSWRINKEKFEEMLKDNRIIFGTSGTARPMQKKFLTEVKAGITPQTWWSRDFADDTKVARYEAKELIPENVFDTPKPVKLIQRCLEISGKPNLMIDFFSGSATSAHSVFSYNVLRKTNTKFIQVQLPEETEIKSTAFKAGYKTIPEIGKERIRRAGKKILEENPELKGKLDIGFKVFKLDESNIKTWETDPEKLDANLFLEDVIKSDRTEEDVLYEILLKYGLDLTLPIQDKQIGSQKLYAIGGGALLVYLGDNANTEIAQEIINWAKELGAINPQAVFKDSGFSNSQDKVNALQLLKSNNITDVWSI